MADIQCTNCGTLNPAGQELCRNCQTPLQGADSYQVGQAPTKKVTAELEPILPQWLRDARSQARKSAEEEADLAASSLLGDAEAEPDLLAGLQAQGRDDDEDVPDWLGNITGRPAESRKPPSEEPTELRRVELRGGTDQLRPPSIPAAQAPIFSADENELPPWLSNITGESEDPRQDTLTGWLKGGMEDLPSPEAEIPVATPPAQPPAEPAADPFSFFENRSDTATSETKSKTKPSFEQSPAIKRPEGYAPLEAGLPDWLKTPEGGPGPARPPDTGELPDWLSKLDTAPLAAPSDPPETVEPPPNELADWLRGDSGDTAAPAVETPGWLDNLDSGTTADSLAPLDSQTISDDSAFTPSWLQNLESPPLEDRISTKDLSMGAPAPAAADPAATGTQGEAFDSPDWLQNLETPSIEDRLPTEDFSIGAGAPPPKGPSSGGTHDESFESPDWLQNLGADTPSTTSAFAEDLKATPAGMTDDLLGGSPDWLKSLGAIEPPDVTPAESPAFSGGSPFAAPAEPKPAEGPTSGTPAPAFTGEIGNNVFSSESLSQGDIDSLFVEMPDWLAAVGGTEATVPPASDSPNVIAPGSLPSWVEAMRPVESAAPSSTSASDRTLEGRGPLAGLQGVLPAVPFFAPSSKPKAYSLKLAASEDQQSHAALLEEVLAVETVPAPIITPRAIASQRFLRLAVAALLFAMLVPTVFGGTQLFPLPLSTDVAAPVQRGLESIWAIPENAPVLVVFDYDPGRAGEMDAIAAPLMDQMILLRHPRLTMISTSPAGSTLVERLFDGPLAGHNYQHGVQYLNLGYLPGGLTGVRAFAQNPTAILPFTFDGAPAWGSPVLQGVQLIPNFAAILVVTDSIEGGRVWIEQAGPLRGASPLVIAASAQTGPLLQPYFQSAQINGLFSGLHDSAVIEQINAGRPGTARRYWDAYSLGLLMAVAVIAGGSLFSMVTAWRERNEAGAT